MSQGEEPEDGLFDEQRAFLKFPQMNLSTPSRAGCLWQSSIKNSEEIQIWGYCITHNAILFFKFQFKDTVGLKQSKFK